jgi:hypothetical protein
VILLPRKVIGRPLFRRPVNVINNSIHTQKNRVVDLQSNRRRLEERMGVLKKDYKMKPSHSTETLVEGMADGIDGIDEEVKHAHKNIRGFYQERKSVLSKRSSGWQGLLRWFFAGSSARKRVRLTQKIKK